MFQFEKIEKETFPQLHAPNMLALVCTSFTVMSPSIGHRLILGQVLLQARTCVDRDAIAMRQLRSKEGLCFARKMDMNKQRSESLPGYECWHDMCTHIRTVAVQRQQLGIRHRGLLGCLCFFFSISFRVLVQCSGLLAAAGKGCKAVLHCQPQISCQSLCRHTSWQSSKQLCTRQRDAPSGASLLLHRETFLCRRLRTDAAVKQQAGLDQRGRQTYRQTDQRRQMAFSTQCRHASSHDRHRRTDTQVEHATDRHTSRQT